MGSFFGIFRVLIFKLFRFREYKRTTPPGTGKYYPSQVPMVPTPKEVPKPHPGGVQGRSWCVTLWSEEDVGRLKGTAAIRALVVGEEVCPDTQRVHYQTYVRFDSNKRFSWWKTQFPTAHVELRRGTEAEAAAYCRKDGRVLVDFGCQVDSERGSDTTEHVLNMLEDGAPLWQVYVEHRRFFFHNHRKITDMEAALKSWRENAIDVSAKRIKGSSPEPSENE